MRVRRSEVSFRVSIHRESLVTGANAMSSSFEGSGPGSPALRANRSRAGPGVWPGRMGFQTVAGASSGSRAIFRGPVRRSSTPAIEVRQLFAAIVRCASVNCTCTSFSASANVAGDTSGPAAGAVLNAGGAPGVVVCVPGFGSSPRHAASTPSRPMGAWIRNWRRVFMALPGEGGTAGAGRG